MSHLACQVCGAACGESWPCVGCQALYYCSSKHRRLGIRLGHDAEECSRMKQQLGRTEEVVNFDIPWDVKTSDEAHSWLKQLHCHGKGLLQYSIRCYHQQQQGSSPDSECTPQQQQQDDARPPESSSRRLQQQQQQQGSDSYPCLPQTAPDWYQGWAPLSVDLVPSWPADNSSSSNGTAAVVQSVDHTVDRINQSGTTQTQQQQQQHGDHHHQQPQGPQGMVTIQSWDDYYSLRNIPKHSPAALCVHFPLTLWYCLTHILPERGYKLPTVTYSTAAEDDSTTTAAAPAAAKINILYLGAQAELQMLAVFSELLLLLPRYDIHIHMIGPDVPQQMHARATKIHSKTTTTAAAAAGSVTISCWNGCWHDVQQEWMYRDTAAAAAAVKEADVSNAPLSSPSSSSWFPASPLSADDQIHLVFAANAGLAAFPSWIQTLLQLATMHSSSSSSTCIGANASHIQQQQQQQQQEMTAAVNHIPVLFSDYCEEAAVKSTQMAECVTNQGFNLTPLLNPFRQPVLLQHHHGTKLPACSNCFIFGWV